MLLLGLMLESNASVTKNVIKTWERKTDSLNSVTNGFLFLGRENSALRNYLYVLRLNATKFWSVFTGLIMYHEDL